MAANFLLLTKSVFLVVIFLHDFLCANCKGVPVITHGNPEEGSGSAHSTPLHELVVDAGDTVILECAGAHFVQWEFEFEKNKVDSSWASRYLVQKEEILPDDSLSYKVTLTLEEAMYNDTGRFKCRYMDGEAAETYLYVRDALHLFRQDDIIVHVDLPPEGPFPLGCRPTNTKIEVAIYQNDNDITADLASHKLKFSLQDGLWITEPVLGYTEPYKCIATFGGESKMVWLFLKIKDPIEPLPSPIISVDPPAPVVGSSVTMTCSVILDINYMATILSWKIPNKYRDEGSWSQGDITRHKPSSIHDEERVVSRTLYISNLTTEDSGVYRCTGSHYNMHPSTATEKIQVFDHCYSFISNFIMRGDTLIKIHSSHKSHVQWVFEVEAIPTMKAVYTWIGPDGNEVPHQLEKRFQMERDSNKNQVKLKINPVSGDDMGIPIDDMGVYEIMVTVPGYETESCPETKTLTKSIKLQLVIEKDPVLNITVKNHNNEFFSTEKSYDMVLRAKGHPLELNSAQLSFYPCERFNVCDTSLTRTFGSLPTMTPIDGVQEELYHFHYETQMRLPNPGESGSGRYEFRACRENQGLCKPQTFDFFVSEAESGFEILEYEEAEAEYVVVHDKVKQFIEDDELKLYCAGSAYKYSHVMWMKSPRTGLQQDWANDNSGGGEISKDTLWDPVDGLYISNASSKFSHIQKLSFDQIQKDHDGRYQCRGVVKDEEESEDSDSRSIRVKVTSKLAPQVVYPYSNMNETSARVDMEGETEIKCAVTGRPLPQIIWYKDDEIINKTNFEEDGTVEFISNQEFQRVYETLHIKFARDVYAGEYKCVGINRVDQIELTLDLEVIDNSPIPLPGIIIGCSFSGVLVIVILIFIWKIWVYNKKIRVLSDAELLLFNEGDVKSINPDLGVDDQADLLPYDRDVEFPRERLKLGKQLGSGAFGRVLKAEATGLVSWEKISIVAVKMVKPQADITYIKALMSELKIMIHLGKHLNIVNLLGACTSNLARRELLVIVEYCRFGNLQKYLMHHRNSYVNQIDPDTNALNFKIGQEFLPNDDYFDGYMVPNKKSDVVDFTVARENCENSAHYVRSASEYPDSANPVAGQPTEYINMVSPGRDPTSVFSFPNQGSVRYTREPVSRQVSKDAERAVLTDTEKAVLTDMKDTEKAVLTDMTEVPMDSADLARESYGSRSYSVGSRLSKTGPGWRSNMKGDYNKQTSQITPICTKDILCWTYQVCRGMEYLSSKKVLHGDLACRNILLAADNVVKICDFGLAKDMYQTNNYHKKTDGPLPVKWLAIECLRDRVFSTQSDVWAFGVVLWEMFSLGNTPYPGIDAGERFYDMLLKGYRMAKPHFAPRDIYKIMLDCWNGDPNKRPRFKELVDVFGDLLEEGELEHYMRLDKKFAKDNVEKEAESYLPMMAAPDFKTVTSMNLGSIENLDDPSTRLLTPNLIEEKDEDGYLAPTVSLHTNDQDGYLTPTTSLPTHDQDGYLIPTSPLNRSPSNKQNNFIPQSPSNIQNSQSFIPRSPSRNQNTIPSAPTSPTNNQKAESSPIRQEPPKKPQRLGQLPLAVENDTYLRSDQEYFLPRSPVLYKPVEDSQPLTDSQGYLITLPALGGSPRQQGLIDPRDYFTSPSYGHAETIKSPSNEFPFSALQHQYQNGSECNEIEDLVTMLPNLN